MIMRLSDAPRGSYDGAMRAIPHTSRGSATTSGTTGTCPTTTAVEAYVQHRSLSVVGVATVVSVFFLLGCAMQVSSGPLEIVHRLTAEPEHDRATIERVLSTRLAEVDAVNPYYAVFTGEPNGPAWLSKVELRRSREGDRSLLILSLDASPCVTPSTIVAEYGQPDDVTRPSPSEAAGSAEEDAGAITYYGYGRPGAEVGFGFRAGGGATCLDNVTFSRDGCLEVRRIPSSAQAQFGDDVRIGAGNIWEGEYENAAGEAVRGPTAGLSVFVRGRPESTQRLRVGAGSRFTAAGESFEIREVRPDGVTLCRRAPTG